MLSRLGLGHWRLSGTLDAEEAALKERVDPRGENEMLRPRMLELNRGPCIGHGLSLDFHAF
jgi:hypothetical protein